MPKWCAWCCSKSSIKINVDSTRGSLHTVVTLKNRENIMSIHCVATVHEPIRNSTSSVLCVSQPRMLMLLSNEKWECNCSFLVSCWWWFISTMTRLNEKAILTQHSASLTWTTDHETDVRSENTLYVPLLLLFNHCFHLFFCYIVINDIISTQVFIIEYIIAYIILKKIHSLYKGK